MRINLSWLVSGYFVGDSSIGEIREMCKAAGFAGIEGAPHLFDGKTDSELEAIRDEFRAAGLPIASFHLPFAQRDDIASFYETDRRSAVDNMKRCISLAAALGAKVCIQHPTTNRNSVETEGLDPYMRQISKSLETLLPEAERLGITVAIENMVPRTPGRFCSQPKHLQMILEEFAGSNLGTCLDIGHANMTGGSEVLDGFFDAMEPSLVAFHLQDNAGDRDSHLAPGHGTTDWNTVFRRISKMSFHRPVCIETPPFGPGPSYSLESWVRLREEMDGLVNDALNPSVSN
jgi:sugar phosphate isomerase/epimerase